jgi:hypothetical protein
VQEKPVTMTAAAGFNYQWFKDGASIANATASAYTAIVSRQLQGPVAKCSGL